MSPPSTSSGSSLGNLARLPLELRLAIYGHAFSLGSLPSLIRSSCAVHAEVAPRLYDTLDIHITPNAGTPFTSISFKRLPGATWTISGETPYNHPRNKLRRIPVNKVNMTRVNIYAPDPAIRGQLLYLLAKVEYLVHSLLEQRTLKNMKHVLVLKPYKGHTWSTPQQREMAATHASFLRNPFPAFPYLRSLVTPRWDLDFFWVPFGKLYKNAKHPCRLSDGSVAEYGDLMQNLTVWWHCELDQANGKEAEMLRLTRKTNRVLDYVAGGAWAWQSSRNLKVPETPMPGAVRGLLGLE